MIASELISKTLSPLQTADTATLALALMDEYKLAHLPVVDGVNFLGLLSETDILAHNPQEIIVNNLLGNLIRLSVREDQHVFDVVSAFSDHRVSLLPVTDHQGHYLGSILGTEFPLHMTKLFACDEPGAVLVLEVNQKDYTLSEIAQLIESNETKVMNLFVVSVPDSNRLEITIKLNRMDIEPVLQALSRYNYQIKATYAEESYHDDLMDRYDSFLRYLNV